MAPCSGYTRPDLEPISFDDLPLGGEWTTRRRTISDSEISLFAAVAGDFSPLTIDASQGTRRVAPPALLVAMAVGLGSMDMSVPSVAAWEWLNWKFPRAVHAGETIYARWTLTQKRAPVGNAPTAIVVWRVDVHTAGGALCAEGEIGASVVRRIGTSKAHVEARVEEPAAGAPPAARRRRGRRRPTGGDGAKSGSDAQVVPAAEAAVTAPATSDGSAAAATTPERAAGGARRRRRRRSPSSTQPRNGDTPAPVSLPAPSAPAEVAPPAARRSAAAGDAAANPLSRVIRRLRRT